MKKFSIIFLIFFLILFTAIIKNSTKRIDDEIFGFKENIRILEKDFENIKLEHNYLSSSERLLKFQDLYFEDLLIKKSIDEIYLLNQKSNFLEIKAFKFSND
tara:strand:+ start:996 stop:1301 length:306 start_codon:yes stop_codon:yes gene_type:complete